MSANTVIKEYTHILNEQEELCLSACICVASVCAGDSKIFDTVQLSEKLTTTEVAKYAEAMHTLLSNTDMWQSMVEKLSNQFNAGG